MDLELYLKQVAGLYSFCEWLFKQIKNGEQLSARNNIIKLSPMSSASFALGRSSRCRGKKKIPFLATHVNEARWIRMIKWSHITLKENDNCLYLVSDQIRGNGVDFFTSPAIAIGIAFDAIEKLSVLAQEDRLGAREYFLENGTEPKVNYHKSLFVLPIKRIGQYDEILPDSINNEFINKSILINEYYEQLFANRDITYIESDYK